MLGSYHNVQQEKTEENVSIAMQPLKMTLSCNTSWVVNGFMVVSFIPVGDRMGAQH